MRFALLAALALIGCSSTGYPGSQDALLVNPGEEVSEELARTISAALLGRKILLAPESFTRSSRVIIEQRQTMGPGGYPANGRDTGLPDHFFLKLRNGQCVLYHVQTDKYLPLKAAKCRAVSA